MIESRRTFLIAALASAGLGRRKASAAIQQNKQPSLADQVGLTTGPFMQHLRANPELRPTLLLDLPRRMREQLDMRVIDVMSETLANTEPAYLDQLRRQVERYECVLTNVKLNLGVDLAAADAALRRTALDEFRRWVRPALTARQPEWPLLVAGYRQLIDYAAPRGIG